MDAAAEICPNCGARVAASPEAMASAKKDPRIAAVISVLPGLGQIYTGQIAKGIVLVIIGVLMLYLVVGSYRLLSGIGLVLYVGFVIYGVYDSYNMAKLINEDLTQAA